MKDSEPSPIINKPKIRVMLVDDSAVIRGLLARALESDSSIEVVSSVHNGELAVQTVQKTNPDVIILDIEMPVMDGITALPLILEKRPHTKILICSTLSAKGAEISMKALSLGATECLVKPTSTAEIGGSEDFQSRLVHLVKSLGGGTPALPKAFVNNAPTAATNSAPLLRNDKQNVSKPALIAIGSSTGGPQALFAVIKHFKNLPVPVIVTQHMPKTFTKILAQHIEKNCQITTHEGAQDMIVENGHVYLAPGGYHMEVVRNKDSVLSLNIIDTEPENYCKPSVDPMMRSAIKLFGNRILGVMLTGMGSDGLESFKQLANIGGRIIAQDEKTSVVWGMPGAIAAAGICNDILPLCEIGPEIYKNVIDN